MENIYVNLKKEVDNSYEILFTENVGGKLSNFLKEKGKGKTCIIMDENVKKYCFDKFIKNFDLSYDILVLPSGEQNKNTENLFKIIDKFNELNLNRNDIVVALGGGVIGDMVGFASAIYKRGMNFVQVPTTLLSMFDSSVGGKTAIDYKNVKNLIGAFKQPQLVLINYNFLETLEKKEVLSGYFEGLKHSLIDSEEHWEFYKKNAELFFENIKSPLLTKVIKKSIQVKANIIMQDETEQGIRKFLNYGHTFGHAVESLSNYKLPHGVAVAFGMIYENLLSANLGKLDIKTLYEVNNFILEKVQNFKTELFDFEDILQKMKKDKKNSGNAITFSILVDFGNMETISINEKDLLEKIYKDFNSFVK